VFTARYGLSLYITQIRLVLQGLKRNVNGEQTEFRDCLKQKHWYVCRRHSTYWLTGLASYCINHICLSHVIQSTSSLVLSGTPPTHWLVLACSRYPECKVLSVIAQNVESRLPTHVNEWDNSVVLPVSAQTRWVIYAIQNTNPPDSEGTALTCWTA
jgi:hypothetical protein